MSEIPTPRTDAAIQTVGLYRGDEMDIVDPDCARQLERELAEAQDRIDDLTATGIHSCGNDCKRPNCVLRRELEKARESEASEARWAAQYKQERDALADIARQVRAGYGGQVVDPDCACEDCEFLGKLDAALATLNPAESKPATPAH